MEDGEKAFGRTTMLKGRHVHTHMHARTRMFLSLERMHTAPQEEHYGVVWGIGQESGKKGVGCEPLRAGGGEFVRVRQRARGCVRESKGVCGGGVRQREEAGEKWRGVCREAGCVCAKV